MKLPRLITRRRAKWVGTTAAVLLCVLYIASGWTNGHAGWSWHSKKDGSDWPANVGIWAASGHLRCVYRDGAWVQGLRRPRRQSITPTGLFGSVEMKPVQNRPKWLSRFNYRSGGDSTGNVTILDVPMWVPLLIVVLPTAYLWRTDRRAKPWQCPKCRYDLRGLDGGVCPECGKSAANKP